MASQTVRVRGLKELQRDFRKMDKELSGDLTRELREAGNVVRDEARGLFVGVDARSAAGFRTRVRRSAVAVQQSRGKTTGQHPEFGRLQMRRALLPALDNRAGEVVERLDKMLGDLAGDNGF